jgi:hypothetical protein
MSVCSPKLLIGLPKQPIELQITFSMAVTTHIFPHGVPIVPSCCDLLHFCSTLLPLFPSKLLHTICIYLLVLIYNVLPRLNPQMTITKHGSPKLLSPVQAWVMLDILATPLVSTKPDQG